MYYDSWNYDVIIMIVVLWFALIPAVAGTIAASVFGKRGRVAVPGKSVFHGAVISVGLGSLSPVACLLFGTLGAIVATPVIAASKEVFVIRTRYYAASGS